MDRPTSMEILRAPAGPEGSAPRPLQLVVLAEEFVDSSSPRLPTTTYATALRGSVDVCPVADQLDVDPPVLLIDAVHHAEIPTMGAV